MTAVKSEPFDILLKGLPVVFCGINPSIRAAQTGHNFGSPSNRFWRVLHSSGFTPVRVRAEDDRSILQYGLGITAASTRATRRAAEITGAELRSAIDLFRRKIGHFRPRTIAFLGRPAFAAIAGSAKFSWGPQPASFADAQVWVLPNPSGLNRAFTLDRLVEEYEKLRLTVAPSLREWAERTSHSTSRMAR